MHSSHDRGSTLRKLVTLLVLLAGIPGVLQAAELSLVNVDILGRNISEDIDYFSATSLDTIYPVYVGTGVQKGKISSVLIIYPPDIGFNTVKSELNKAYHEYQQPPQGSAQSPLAIWHLPNKIEIQMQMNEKGTVEVTFLTNESFEW